MKTANFSTRLLKKPLLQPRASLRLPVESLVVSVSCAKPNNMCDPPPQKPSCDPVPVQSCDLRYLTAKVINYRILGTGDRIALMNRNPQGRTGPDALNRTSTADQTLRKDLVNFPRVSGPLGMNIMDSSQLHRDILNTCVMYDVRTLGKFLDRSLVEIQTGLEVHLYNRSRSYAGNLCSLSGGESRRLGNLARCT